MNKISNDSIEHIQEVIAWHSDWWLYQLEKDVRNNWKVSEENQKFLDMVNDEIDKRKWRVNDILDKDT